MNCWPYLLRSWSLSENVVADSHTPHGSLLGLRPLSSLSLWVTRVLPLCSSSDSQTNTIHSVLAWNISGMDHLCFCCVCHLCPMSSILSYVAVATVVLFPVSLQKHGVCLCMAHGVLGFSSLKASCSPSSSYNVSGRQGELCLVNTSIPLGEVVPVFLCLT